MRTLAALAAAAVLLTGCAAREDAAPAGAPAPPGTPTPAESSPGAGSPSDADDDGSPAADEEVPESLRFEARTVSGEPFDGASLAGRPALLWFWAPWCPTCRGQIPQVEELAATYAGELTVVGIGSLDDAEAIAGFAEDVGGVRHLTDSEGTVWRHFGIAEQSSFVLLDGSGRKVFSTGYGGADDLGDRVADVVG